MSFLLQSEHIFEIDIDETGTTPDLQPIAKGISSVEPSNNEELDQTHYYDGNGFATTDVLGAQLTLAFSGHRFYGDPAQDFIFGKAMSVGNDRKTTFSWTLPDGGNFEGEATIASIEGPGGESNAKGEISFEIHFNGLPTYTPPAG